MSSPLGRSAPHESAHLHVTGRATYVADEQGPPSTGFVLPVPSPAARGRIVAVHTKAARAMPGVRAVLVAADIPGELLWGPIQHTEPLLADGRVHYHGQAVALVVADTEAAAVAAADAVRVDVLAETPVLTIEDAVAAGTFHTPAHVIQRGDLKAAFTAADLVLEGEVSTPAQDHFYLETQAALVIPEEDGTWRVRSSTQHPTEIQNVVAHTLGVSASRVVVEVPRVGGGFGGKESQASPYAAYAALGAWATGRPCRCWLHRDQDMAWTGKRHPFRTSWRAAFDTAGRILGYEATLYSNGGWTLDLSGPVMDRALFHADSAYYLPATRIEGRVCSTNLPSNTAFRGFGGPQGMVAIEEALDAAAAQLGIDPTDIRVRNLYGPAPRDRAPFGQVIVDNRLPRLVPELLASADVEARTDAVAAFNASSRHIKRGIGFMPVKFGISFTASLLNQAGALVHVYTDGSVQVNHGGTEMGQGLHTKLRAVAADAFGIDTEQVRVMVTATDKVPNTSATAASSGSDLNGAAVLRACEAIRSRMAEVAVEVVGADPVFADGEARGPTGTLPFAALASRCWASQVSLSATGYYATPGIAYDPALGQGTPFFYFAFGAAVAEVELNGLTGEHRVRRMDILHDVGDPLVPSIDIGQVEGAFVQGVGWLTCEDVLYDDAGRLITHGPSTYKIPAVGDVPLDMRVALLDRAPNDRVVGGSKAVGEPPFMLGLSVITALRAAVAEFGSGPVQLALPATPENLLRAIVDTQDAGALAAR
ncbi:MAG: xanthine dehydrogenase large subunit [Myxococcota bacterium]|jgi:xanthine dehydrogenase large subunit